MNWIYGYNRPSVVIKEQNYGQVKYVFNFGCEKVDDMWRWLSLSSIAELKPKAEIVSEIVRMRYSVDDVEAITANVLNDPFNEERIAEYKALQEWRAKAKIYATELMAYAEEHGIAQAEPQEETSYGVTGVELVPDGVTMLMQGLKLLKTQALELGDEQAAEVPALFPTWESLLGQAVEVGKRLFYAGRLWKVLQAHTIQANWTPDVVPALFTEVVVQGEGEPEIGTLDNPIPYNGNMELEEGKYYSQDGVVYRCIRSTGAPVYHPLSALVNIYVEVV